MIVESIVELVGAVESIALCNIYTLKKGRVSRNHFKANELIPMLSAKPNYEQKPNWRY